MLERISWSTYWAVIVIGLVIYYTVLLILLYQKGFFFKGSIKTIPSHSGTPDPSSNPQRNLFGLEETVIENPGDKHNQQLAADDNILMPIVHDLIQELKEFITGISERSYVKEEVIMGVQIIIKNYKRIEDSPYQKSINDFIKSECEEYCSIHLSEDEIGRIWKG